MTELWSNPMTDPVKISLSRFERALEEWDALASFAEEHDLTIEEAEREVQRQRDEAMIDKHHAGDMWP